MKILRACAIREFIEETGYKPKKLKHLIDYYPFIGYNTQKIHCYVAQDIEKVSEIKLEYDEFLTLVKMDFKKLLKMIGSGKIVDSKTICAALTYANSKKNLIFMKGIIVAAGAWFKIRRIN